MPGCPAGFPIGTVQLRVSNTSTAAPISLRTINVIQEGDVISYSPVTRTNEKRHGKVTVVLVPEPQHKDKDRPFVVLEPKDADKAEEWKVPFRTSLVVYVYGPNGLSAGNVRGFLDKDDELISQLADYAEKTAQTEALLQAMSMSPDASSAGDAMSATLQGLAGQYGLSNKVDRTAPTDQQTLAILRGLNPTLSAYDPISPQGPQRLSQTAGLATVIAGMFFGSPVGLAAGGTAMAMNLKTLMFPNSEFRSTFAQPAKADSLSMCGNRAPAHGRTRLAYLWAVRIPDSAAPHIAITAPSTVAQSLDSAVAAEMPEAEWKLADRVRNWALRGDDGKAIPVAVKVDATHHALNIDLSKVTINPGSYQLTGMWDWTLLPVQGKVSVRPLSSFAQAHIDRESQDRLLQHSGKDIVNIEGDDFEFVEKVALSRIGDKYDAPVDVPFSLPSGARKGPQPRMEMRIDTGALDAGAYSLMLVQQGGKVSKVPLEVLADPPKLDTVPVIVSAKENAQSITLRGERLDRITNIDAGAVKIQLGPVLQSGRERKATIELPADAQEGASYDLKLTVHQHEQPLLIPAGLKIGPPRPRIVDSKLALPADLEVTLRTGELPAGIFVSALMHAQNTTPQTVMHLGCRKKDGPDVSVKIGEQNAVVKVQAIGSDSFFVSLDPGAWPPRCTLEASLENPGEEGSAAFRLGTVVRFPHIVNFRLTDEAAGNGNYVAVLTGRDLELIAKTGWDAANGTPVAGLPTPITGQPQMQSLSIVLPWPSPAPHSPLYIWLRGDREGRATTLKY